MTFYALPVKRLLLGAGAYAQDRIRRATAHQAGQQWNNAEPAPPTHGSRGRQGDQDDTHQYAQNPVNGSNIAFHTIASSVGKRRGALIPGRLHQYTRQTAKAGDSGKDEPGADET